MMIGLPLILFQVKGGEKDMGDIIDLAIKEFEGKTVKNNFFRSTSGTLATLTADTGKDMYLAVAEGTIATSLTTTVVDQVTVDLVVNSVTVESISVLVDVNSRLSPYKFKFSGKVTTGQTISIEATIGTAGSAMQMTGNLECFEEDTGNTPAIT